MALVVRIVLAAILLVAAATKLSAPRQAAAALETYDVPQRFRLPLALGLTALEVVLAATIAGGAAIAAYAAAVLLATFAAATTRALLRGRRGAPCGCFGPRSRIGWAAVVRDAVLAVAFVAVPALPTSFPSTTGWLAVGLAAAFVCIGALTVAVLALTRELGILRLRLPPDVALDVADEGPALGSQLALTLVGEVPITLAIFSSDGCRLCRAVEPAVAAFGSQPGLTVEVFDEVRDADVWKRLRVPGSPYAVAIDRTGKVRAKGTFNSYGQLEAIVVAAEGELARAAVA